MPITIVLDVFHRCCHWHCTVESRTTLLSNELKRHLFNLFASWSGPTAKPLGFSHAGFGGSSSNGATSTACASSNNSSLGISGTNASGTSASLGNISLEEEKLQFSALQVSQRALHLIKCETLLSFVPVTKRILFLSVFFLLKLKDYILYLYTVFVNSNARDIFLSFFSLSNFV